MYWPRRDACGPGRVDPDVWGRAHVVALLVDEVEGIHLVRRSVAAPQADREARADVAGAHGFRSVGRALVGIWV